MKKLIFSWNLNIYVYILIQYSSLPVYFNFLILRTGEFLDIEAGNI